MSETATHHRLEGLEPDNLLAFLVLLGLLRSLELASPQLRPRAFWDFSTAPLRPKLTICQSMSKEDVCVTALSGLAIFRDALRPLHWLRTGMPATRSRFRSLAQRCVKAFHACETDSDKYKVWRARCDVIACLATEVYGGKNEVEQTPLKLPSAQMAFIGAMFSLADKCDASDLSHALFNPWKYDHKGNSLRLSPDEAQRYAYRASDPSPEGAHTQKGATALSGPGLLSFPMSSAAKGVRLPAYRGTRREGGISWPIWSASTGDEGAPEGASLPAIEAMLRAIPLDPKVSFTFLENCALVATARRYILDPSQGDYGNISRATMQRVGDFS
jgi:hypothetical protein